MKHSEAITHKTLTLRKKERKTWNITKRITKEEESGFFQMIHTQKKGIIRNIDDLGFTILITEADERSSYVVGKTYFFNQATNLTFFFLD